MADGRALTVVGIMPASFEFPLPLFNVTGAQFGEQADIWQPLGFTDAELKRRGSRSYGVIGRLAPGVSPRRRRPNWKPSSGECAASSRTTIRRATALARPFTRSKNRSSAE